MRLYVYLYVEHLFGPDVYVFFLILPQKKKKKKKLNKSRGGHRHFKLYIITREFLLVVVTVVDTLSNGLDFLILFGQTLVGRYFVCEYVQHSIHTSIIPDMNDQNVLNTNKCTVKGKSICTVFFLVLGF